MAGIAIAVGFVVWLLLRGGGGSTGPANKQATPAPQRAPATAATIDQLRAVAAAKPYPVYWLGPRLGSVYELTQTADGKVYVRYLPRGVPIGVNRPNYATVATYPQRDGFATVTQASKLKGEYIHKLAQGGLAVASPALPRSVYLSYPGAKYMVEIFDPVPKRARTFVTSGKIQPIH